ncbi:MAG: hypothetical protein ABI249_07570 [Ornithinibacter sp.]
MPVIHVDTSDLTYGWFWVPGHLSHFVDGSRPGGVEVTLPPGDYAFQQTRERASDLRFRVRDDGLVDYERRHEGFLRGRGTPTLRVVGVPLTLDSEVESLQVLPLWGGCFHPIATREQSVRLAPGTAYEIRLGRAANRVLAFDVGHDGVVDYDPQFDSIMSGRGTRRLTVTSPA